jgi:hypothetical protein
MQKVDKAYMEFEEQVLVLVFWSPERRAVVAPCLHVVEEEAQL